MNIVLYYASKVTRGYSPISAIFWIILTPGRSM
jgi:hypothetical protein